MLKTRTHTRTSDDEPSFEELGCRNLQHLSVKLIDLAWFRGPPTFIPAIEQERNVNLVTITKRPHFGVLQKLEAQKRKLQAFTFMCCLTILFHIKSLKPPFSHSNSMDANWRAFSFSYLGGLDPGKV